MQTRLRSYGAYSIGCVVVWLIILATATVAAEESKRRRIWLTCAGWWLGWLSATIARQVYPPSHRGEAPSGA